MRENENETIEEKKALEKYVREIFLYLKGKFINIMMSVKWMFHTFIACIQLFIANLYLRVQRREEKNFSMWFLCF